MKRILKRAVCFVYFPVAVLGLVVALLDFVLASATDRVITFLESEE